MTTVSTASVASGPFVGGTGVLWKLNGANMNSTADQAFVKQFAFTSFVIDKIIAMNPSTSMTLAAGGIYTATAKGGTAIVAAAQTYAGLVSAGNTLNTTLASTDKRSDAALYLALTLAQGVAATADIWIFGTAIN